MLMHTGDSNRLSHVILDDVHERSDNTDMLLTILKNYYFTHCSGTKESTPFVIEMSFEPKCQKKIFYLDDMHMPPTLSSKFLSMPQLYEKCMEVVKTLITKKLSENIPDTKILIFLPGLYRVLSRFFFRSTNLGLEG